MDDTPKVKIIETPYDRFVLCDVGSRLLMVDVERQTIINPYNRSIRQKEFENRDEFWDKVDEELDNNDISHLITPGIYSMDDIEIPHVKRQTIYCCEICGDYATFNEGLIKRHCTKVHEKQNYIATKGYFYAVGGERSFFVVKPEEVASPEQQADIASIEQNSDEFIRMFQLYTYLNKGNRPVDTTSAEFSRTYKLLVAFLRKERDYMSTSHPIGSALSKVGTSDNKRYHLSPERSAWFLTPFICTVLRKRFPGTVLDTVEELEDFSVTFFARFFYDVHAYRYAHQLFDTLYLSMLKSDTEFKSFRERDKIFDSVLQFVELSLAIWCHVSESSTTTELDSDTESSPDSVATIDESDESSPKRRKLTESAHTTDSPSSPSTANRNKQFLKKIDFVKSKFADSIYEHLIHVLKAHRDLDKETIPTYMLYKDPKTSNFDEAEISFDQDTLQAVVDGTIDDYVQHLTEFLPKPLQKIKESVDHLNASIDDSQEDQLFFSLTEAPEKIRKYSSKAIRQFLDLNKGADNKEAFLDVLQKSQMCGRYLYVLIMITCGCPFRTSTLLSATFTKTPDASASIQYNQGSGMFSIQFSDSTSHLSTDDYDTFVKLIPVEVSDLLIHYLMVCRPIEIEIANRYASRDLNGLDNLELPTNEDEDAIDDDEEDLVPNHLSQFIDSFDKYMNALSTRIFMDVAGEMTIAQAREVMKKQTSKYAKQPYDMSKIRIVMSYFSSRFTRTTLSNIRINGSIKLSKDSTQHLPSEEASAKGGSLETAKTQLYIWDKWHKAFNSAAKVKHVQVQAQAQAQIQAQPQSQTQTGDNSDIDYDLQLRTFHDNQSDFEINNQDVHEQDCSNGNLDSYNPKYSDAISNLVNSYHSMYYISPNDSERLDLLKFVANIEAASDRPYVTVIVTPFEGIGPDLAKEFREVTSFKTAEVDSENFQACDDANVILIQVDLISLIPKLRKYLYSLSSGPKHIRRLVFDDAHTLMLDDYFRETLKEFTQVASPFSQILLLASYMAPQFMASLTKRFNFHDPIEYRLTTLKSNIQYKVISGRYFKRYVKSNQPKDSRAVIYCNDSDRAKKLSTELGYLTFNEDMSDSELEKSYEAFAGNATTDLNSKVLVCTSAFMLKSRIPDITDVFFYQEVEDWSSFQLMLQLTNKGHPERTANVHILQGFGCKLYKRCINLTLSRIFDDDKSGRKCRELGLALCSKCVETEPKSGVDIVEAASSPRTTKLTAPVPVLSTPKPNKAVVSTPITVASTDNRPALWTPLTPLTHSHLRAASQAAVFKEKSASSSKQLEKRASSWAVSENFKPGFADFCSSLQLDTLEMRCLLYSTCDTYGYQVGEDSCPGCGLSPAVIEYLTSDHAVGHNCNLRYVSNAMLLFIELDGKEENKNTLERILSGDVSETDPDWILTRIEKSVDLLNYKRLVAKIPGKPYVLTRPSTQIVPSCLTIVRLVAFNYGNSFTDTLVLSQYYFYYTKLISEMKGSSGKTFSKRFFSYLLSIKSEGEENVCPKCYLSLDHSIVPCLGICLRIVAFVGCFDEKIRQCYLKEPKIKRILEKEAINCRFVFWNSMFRFVRVGKKREDFEVTLFTDFVLFVLEKYLPFT